MAYVRHGSLTSGEPAEVELPVRGFGAIEILKRTVEASLYFRVLNPSEAATAEVTVAGDDCDVLPAGSLSALEVDSPAEPITILLVADADCDYSIRAS